MSAKLELNQELVIIFEEPIDKEGAIRKLAALLSQGGYVKDTFENAVIEREKVFPTGLPTQPFGIAIPHTDAVHVNKGAIAVGILKSPVVFKEMGDLENDVEVSIISMLAIENPKLLIPLLRQLAKSFQDKEFLEKLKGAEDPKDVFDQYKRIIPDFLDLV